MQNVTTTTVTSDQKAPADDTELIFDRLIADLGDPVIRPAIDRSYDAISRLSETERTKSAGAAKKRSSRAS